MQHITFPPSLQPGDKVAIISPASPVRDEFIDRGAEFIKANGFEPVIFPYAKGPAEGSYAAGFRQRLDDFIAAFSMPEIKAVICGRGGYGAVHLLPHIPGELLRDNPKWLVGFSDISAFHALSLAQGVASVHGPMTKHYSAENKGAREVIDILSGKGMARLEATRDLSFPNNFSGCAEGILTGGNVAVLDGLAATPFDLFARSLSEDIILFIEDIAEPIYKIERILYRLYMQGVLSRIKGLAVGRFTEYKGDSNYESMEEMISDFLQRNHLTDFPVGFGFPIGHIEDNRPVIEGQRVRLECTSKTAILTPIS